MIETPRALGPMVTAPHHLAATAGLDVLRAGGNAAEALVATLAALAIVYPHMTGLGGDAFWLLAPPGADPIGIDGAGHAGRQVTTALYRDCGLAAIPARGPLAANTVPGGVASWKQALSIASTWSRAPRPTLFALLEPAIRLAETGVPLARGLALDSARLAGRLGAEPGFLDTYGETVAGTPVRRPRLASTLRHLAVDGLDGFYHGALADRIAADLARVGAPLDREDLAAGRASVVTPLTVTLGDGIRLFNLPPPTQGLVSLMILAIHDRLPWAAARPGEDGGFAHVHALVEAAKHAFRVRDGALGDPGRVPATLGTELEADALERAAAAIDPHRASAWPDAIGDAGGDTVWCGAVDAEGGMASAIGSIFHEFGSGVVLPDTGITWQNRGSAFTLDDDGPRALAPGRKPFHTLNPAMAFFPDGRRMVYGTMGGEGQPQTQAALFTRYARYGLDLQPAVTAPRWLLGRSWGAEEVSLRTEADLPAAADGTLARAGHDVAVVPPRSALMGHAGAIVLRPDGVREGATDPRSDGGVACA